MREMIPNVLLIDDTCNLHNLLKIERNKYQAVVCLFWASPETKRLVSDVFEGTCYSLGDIIRSVDLLEKELTECVQRICDEGPKYRGLALRRYLSEDVFRSWLYPRICASTLKFLGNLRSDLKVERLEVNVIASDQSWSIIKRLGASSVGNGCLSLIPHAERLKICLKKPSQVGIVKRLVRQFRGAKISGQWQAQIWNLIEKIDKDYGKRCSWNRFRKPIKISSGMITFFSSYLNNSRILQPFERLMPGSVQWIVTNYYARMPISDHTKHISWIWKFDNSQDQKIKFKDDTILNDCERESGKNGVLRICLPESKLLQSWNNGQLASVAKLTYCWEKYLVDVKPKLVVMANQWGIEGWFTQIAKQHGIPVLQVMHGVFGGHFYTQTPIISDIMVVPGEFWRNLWPKDEQPKVAVYNPEGYIGKVRKRVSPDRRRLTFFSWPLLSTPFYNSSELMEGFIHTFHKLLSKGTYEVLVRAHPLENLSDFVKRWEELYGSLPSGLLLGKHEPLDQVLAQTDVALMFRSTVMLNCMASKVPILIPGWIDSGLNEVLREVPGVHLAHDLADLENKLLEWLDRPPEVSEQVAEYFVRSPEAGRELFSSLLEDLIAGQRVEKKTVL